MTFLAPQFLWALLAVPLVVLLHFIRTRKRRQDVAALFLWRRAQELAQARRRFSPTWLLALQLLFVTLAALALAQPTFTVAGAPDRVIVIDASASMAARDSDGVRLAKAVQAAEELLRDTGPVAVIRAGLDATVLQPLTSDHTQVRQALETLVAADAHADLTRALELAQQIAPDAEIHLLTDNEPPPGITARLDAVLHAVGGDGQNLGITAFELRNQQAFVSITSNTTRPQEVEVEVLRGDVPIARTTLLVPVMSQANASFPIDGAAGIYRARINAPEWDALELDNVAYAGNRNLRVQLVPPSDPLQRALSAIPGLDWRSSQSIPAGTSYDVLILTGDVPADPPPGRYLIFAPAAAEPRYVRIADWDRSDPLLRFVDLTETRVGLPQDVVDLPEGEWQVLAQAEDLTPVLVRRTTPEVDMIIARFHPSQTDMINRPAFPLLITNIMDAFRGEGRLVLGSRLPEGEVLFNGEPTAQRRVFQPGVYRVDTQLYTASLLSAEQTRLPGPVDTATAAPEPAERTVTERQQSIALWLVFLAFLALVAEWLLWSRGQSSWVSRA